MQHGSILVDDDQSALLDLSVMPIDNHRWSPPASLHSLLGRAPDATEVASAMLYAVRSLEDDGVTELAESDIRAEALARVPQFLDEDWTWRR